MSEDIYKAELTTITVYDADKKATEHEVLCETGDTEGSLRLKIRIADLERLINTLTERVLILEKQVGV